MSLHLLTDKGNQKGLFRGAIMQSGGPIPVGDIENGQTYYDSMVEHTRCGNSTDTLECLRQTPYPTFKHAMDLSPDFMSYQVWKHITTLPRMLFFLTTLPRDLFCLGYLVSMASS